MKIYEEKCVGIEVMQTDCAFIFFYAEMRFSPEHHLAVDPVEEAGFSELSGRQLSMQIYAARKSSWIPVRFLLTTEVKQRQFGFCFSLCRTCKCNVYTKHFIYKYNVL